MWSIDLDGDDIFSNICFDFFLLQNYFRDIHFMLNDINELMIQTKSIYGQLNYSINIHKFAQTDRSKVVDVHLIF